MKSAWPTAVLPLLLAAAGARADEPDEKGRDNTEPEYDLIVHDGVSHGVGSTGGLLAGW